jgi:TM2 domain-containing membrane protein YozV
MNCYVHPENEAIGTCTSCGRPICRECAVEMHGKLICRPCLASGKASAVAQTDKDVNTAFLIELVGGFFGLLGIGYMYVGRTNDGIIRLIAWIIYDVIAAITISLLLAVFVGILCIPLQLAIQIGVPLWSANNLKTILTSGNPS